MNTQSDFAKKLEKGMRKLAKIKDYCRAHGVGDDVTRAIFSVMGADNQAKILKMSVKDAATCIIECQKRLIADFTPPA